jgi:hypothetical protein
MPQLGHEDLRRDNVGCGIAIRGADFEHIICKSLAARGSLR